MLELLMNSTPTPPMPPGEYALRQTAATQAVYWTVPDDITSICCVCVGHGGMGGGGLSWRNNIPVTPGEILTIHFTITSNGTSASGNTRLLRESSVLCIAYAGAYVTTTYTNAYGGYGGKTASSINDGGGDGGRGYKYSSTRASGGGAGGYLGKGGDETSLSSGGVSVVGGGGSGARSSDPSGYGAGGGDVGLYGIGVSGALPTSGGNKSGNTGSPAPMVCGGGVNTITSAFNGGIRIIWGEGYSYPNNAVAK